MRTPLGRWKGEEDVSDFEPGEKNDGDDEDEEDDVGEAASASRKDAAKNKASRFAKKHPMCIADGNELLRFHCTMFTCSLRLSDSATFCGSIPRCRACSIVWDGIKAYPLGRVQTLAMSGRAHNTVRMLSDGEKRAMLVFRVIAGRVKMIHDANE